MSPIPQQAQQEDEKKFAPRYLVAYCSIMTLLLAFFIILQAFGPEQDAGLYHAGRGSFIRALETFGLGGIWEKGGGKVIEGHAGPRYRAEEGEEEPPRLRRIDPEMEDAQQALQDLEEQFDVRQLEGTTGYRVELSTPISRDISSRGLTPEEEEFLEQLAPRLERVVLASGFLVRIGTVLPRGEGGAERTRAGLTTADRVRSKLIEGMSPAARKTAARRIYSFFRRDSISPGPAEPQPELLKVDIVLTKPHLRQLRQEGVQQSEWDTSS